MVEYSNAWREWLVENLIRGSDQAKVRRTLVSHGFDAAFMSEELRNLDKSPAIAAARKLSKRLQKLESLLAAQSELFKRSGFASEFGQKRRLTAEEFYRDYFFRNLPVIVTGWMDDWDALRTWSPRNFRERFGHLDVEVMSDRDKDPLYEDHADRHRRRMLLRDFVDLITAETPTNAAYLVAKNSFLTRPEVAVLNDEFHYPPGILDSDGTVHGDINLWMGPAGTVTPLHHDSTNILLGQVYGRKHLKMIPSHDIAKIYNDRSFFSAVDMSRPDFEAFPLLRTVTILDVVINPGEFVFFPLGWWHWVKALDPSISLSFRNLRHGSSSIIWHNVVRS